MDKKVYYDGECALCSAAVEHIGPEVERIDIHSGVLPAGVTFDQSMRDMYLVEGDRMFKGSEAVLRLLGNYRFLGWLAHAGHLPGFRRFAAGLYRLIATNRYLFGRNVR